MSWPCVAVSLQHGVTTAKLLLCGLHKRLTGVQTPECAIEVQWYTSGKGCGPPNNKPGDDPVITELVYPVYCSWLDKWVCGF